MALLEFQSAGEPVAPKHAATIALVRRARNSSSEALEILCVKRSERSRFLGGAVVFPGGKVDELDEHVAWARLTTPPCSAPESFAHAKFLAPLAIAACREVLEEVGILLSKGEISSEFAALARQELARGKAFFDILSEASLTLDLARLLPLSRWLTPEAESRRYDTRFYLAVAPEGHEASSDAHEVTDCFWDTPKNVLQRFEQGELELAPPTHRTLELLEEWKTIDRALEEASRASLEVICPLLVEHTDVRGSTLALVLPGDPAHPVQERRIGGRTRFVLRQDRWHPEAPPADSNV